MGLSELFRIYDAATEVVGGGEVGGAHSLITLELTVDAAGWVILISRRIRSVNQFQIYFVLLLYLSCKPHRT